MAKVFLGVSGGVDSAIAIKILLDQKHEVVGGFMRNWDSMANNDFLGNPTIDEAICPQEQDYEDAKKVCAFFGIELVRLDFVKEYWEEVFSYFIDEYKKGRTPNPDILCNKFIKFDYFLKYAMANGFDFIAMGHYAKVVHDEKGSFLKVPRDLNKDQTYFLAQLNQYQLSKSLFPLADYTKKEIRKMACDLDIVVARKKDSTGICFIGERDFRVFLQNYIPAQKGNIIDYKSKKVLGIHNGVMYYTIGQSKGLGIGGQKEFSGAKWYVIGKSISKKELYVSNDLDYELIKCDQVLVKDIMINNDLFKGTTCAHVSFRYNQIKTSVRLEWLNDSDALVSGKDLPKAITPGQEAVFYIDDFCIGGGTIDKLYRNGKEIDYE
jgi:tRNA-specific 2-thiouridylase